MLVTNGQPVQKTNPSSSSDWSDNSATKFCVMPWINQHVTTNGNIAPCCEYDGHIGALSDATLNEAWHSPQLREIRRKFVAGEEVKECWKCFDREASEGFSLRTQAKRDFPDWQARLLQATEPLNAAPKRAIALDLRFSNLCNFKCRSCWHGASSKWFRDAKAIGVTAGQKAEIKSFESIDEVVRQLGPDMDSLELVYFAGGEPLIMEEHYALLRILHDRRLTHVKLSYNTNLSVTKFAGQSIFDLWAKFEFVDVTASVDAAGARGGYLRSGFNWDTFVMNVHELRNKCPSAKLNFGITVSALNILTLTDLFHELENKCQAIPSEFELHSLQDPTHYRTQVLPPHLKRKARNKIEAYISEKTNVVDNAGDNSSFIVAVRGIVDYMNASDLSDKLPDFKFITDQLDKLRSENARIVLPELNPAFEKTPWWKKPWYALKHRLG